MSNLIIARTHIGGQDLYFGMPDLDGAVVVRLENAKTEDDYITRLHLKLRSGGMFILEVRQERS